MKYTVAIFALFTVAMGQFVKVPRQAATGSGVKIQGAAMSTTDGQVVPFDTANVNMAATKAGL
ncbi:hypothetical protein F5Y19DRAFT_478810 [Xylariaceae sp. FL1651]|nr:hypothetical protein F5Y19DRAFT_478810 [Xylariaceae sp. FL1651]